MTLELSATLRDMKKDSPESLKNKGFIPSIFYGKKQKSTPIIVSIAEFTKIWKTAGESSVVTIKMGSELYDCLIYAVDLDPIKNTPRHADFYVFEKGQKLKVKVPIEFVGVSPAVKDLGGVLVKVLHELEIEASPKDLPHRIEVDISSLLDFKSQMLAKAVKLPTGVSLVNGPEEVVASVYEPKEEKIEEVPTAPDLSAIEVEKKGKKEEEGAEAAPGTDKGAATTQAEKKADKK
ncbi:MAG TPA: 50S ribosomal protein L25 [Candidatus Paceibacterota bacterium]